MSPKALKSGLSVHPLTCDHRFPVFARYIVLVKALIFNVFAPVFNVCFKTLPFAALVIGSQTLALSNQCAKVYVPDGKTLFRVDMIDPELGISTQRAKSLRASHLLEIGKGVPDARLATHVQIKNVRSLLGDMWKRIENVSPESVNKSQEIVAGRFLSDFKVLGEGKNDDTQTKAVIALQKEVSDLLGKEDSDSVSKEQLNRLGYSISLLMAHVNGATKPKLNGQFLRPQMAVYDSRIFLADLRTAFPSFVSLHPESYLYLMSRGLYAWKIGEKVESTDGFREVEPYVNSLHDTNHIGLINEANKKMTLSRMKNTFDEALSQVLNKPGQTLRERELTVHVLFFAWFESAHEFSFSGLRQAISGLQAENEFNGRSYFLEQINSPDSFGSKMIHEQPVDDKELDQILSHLTAWLEQKGH